MSADRVFERFKGRRGHGGISELAERTGISRSYLGQVLSGRRTPKDRTRDLILGAISEIENGLPQESQHRESQRYESPESILASKLYSLADMLTSRDFDTDAKVRVFSKTITLFYEEIESLESALKKSTHHTSRDSQ